MSADERYHDRQKVIEKVDRWVQRRMDAGSIEEYIIPARQYAEKYQISLLVDLWIKEAREGFISQEMARKWANTLP